jgi:hypothetical protein
MKKIISLFTFFVIFSLLVPQLAYAGGCYYSSTQLSKDGKVTPIGGEVITCQIVDSESLCDKICETGGVNYKKNVNCKFKEEKTTCETQEELNRKIEAPVVQSSSDLPSGYRGFIPSCAFERDTDKRCRNINDLLIVLINMGEYVFGLIGSVAFIVFIYGGFVVVTSFGNAEKVKKGYQILGAAVIGLVIAFSAYLLVDFILDTILVQPEFRSIK